VRLHDLGYGSHPMAWRMAAMSTEWLNIKIKALQDKVADYNNDNYPPVAELSQIRNVIAQAIDTNQVSHQHLKSLINGTHPQLWEALQQPLRKQFGRGVAKNIFELQLGATNLEDVNLMQRIDPTGEYFAHELLHILDDAIFYRDLSIEKTNDGGFSIKSKDPADPNKTIELASAKLQKGANGDKFDKMTYELKVNSQGAALELIDSIAQMRQGETNAITIVQVGPPLETLTFLYEAIVTNHMHVIMDIKQQQELLADIDKLAASGHTPDQVNQLRELAILLIDNRDLYDYETPNRVNKARSGGIASWVHTPAYKGTVSDEVLTALTTVNAKTAGVPRSQLASGSLAELSSHSLGSLGYTNNPAFRRVTPGSLSRFAGSPSTSTTSSPGSGLAGGYPPPPPPPRDRSRSNFFDDRDRDNRDGDNRDGDTPGPDEDLVISPGSGPGSGPDGP
jgi:hypothetical protein